MRFFLAALIISILILPVQQPTPVCVIAGSDLAASLADAESGPRCLEIPAGVWSISPAGGSYLNATVDNLEIRGAGVGRTIISTQGVTLTAEMQVIRLHGANQKIHDLTIALATSYSGAYGVYGISIYDEATGSTVEDVEVSGGYTPNGSAGAGVALYRTWGHAAQFTTVRGVWLHDMPTSGVVVNSSNNVFLHNRLERVGASTLAHGFYAQGGYNLYEGNFVSAASGYSFHGYKQVPRMDGSGDIYRDNVSLNPGAGHLIIQGLPPDATNTDLPSGARLTRYATVVGNLFRNTPGHISDGLLTVEPATIEGNTFEDAGKVGGAILNANAPGAIVSNNRIIMRNAASYGIFAGVGVVVEGNTLDSTGGLLVGINASGATVTNNRVLMASGTALSAGYVNTTVSGNDLTVLGSGTLIGMPWLSAGVVIRDNVLSAPAGAKYYSIPSGNPPPQMDRNITR